MRRRGGRDKLRWITCTASAVYSALPFFSSLNIDAFIYRMIPFVVTLIVLAISSKGAQGPAVAGQPYDKSAR